jgi:nickel-dependent lactate racemase
VPEFKIPYGKSYLVASLPDPWQPFLVMPKQVAPAPDPNRVVNRALDSPLGDRGLSEFGPVRSAAIAINDKTRPVPHDVLLPPLLARLEALGMSPDTIRLIIATGSHPPLTTAEFPAVVPPEILARYPVICHDAKDQANLVFLGQTARDTPVWMNRHFIQADLRLVVGNVEPHQFMGFSGGVKSAVIGLAGLATINQNHAMMTDPRAKLGVYDDNPARQDVEEMGRLVGVNFALNVILNESKQIVTSLAGDPTVVMQAGIPIVRELYRVGVSGPCDVVIASPGGYPKDINLYQAQKALAHAALITKAGGTVILVAACPEQTGSKMYEEWMAGMASHEAVFERFKREGFRIGPHKAFQIARDASRGRVLLVSDMPPDLVERLLLTPVSSLDEALVRAVAHLKPARARIAVLPVANATIPYLEKRR